MYSINNTNKLIISAGLCLLALIFCVCPPASADDIEAVLDSADGSSGLSVQDSGAAEIMRVDSDGNATIGGSLEVQGSNVFLPGPNAAPVDGAFDNSQWTIWLDEGSNEFELKAKKSDGTVISQTVVASAGASDLDGLSDVNSSTATAGRLLIADGTDFESVQLQGDCTINGAGFISCSAGGAVGDLVDLSDVNSATVTAGRLLVADGTEFESMALQGDASMNGAGFITIEDDAITAAKIAASAVGSSEIAAGAVGVSELADINSATKTAGRLLIADGTDFESMLLQGDCSLNGAGYIDCSAGAGATQLDALSDVNSSTITAGRLLIADGTGFESMQLQGDCTLNGAGFITCSSGGAVGDLVDLSDVNSATVTAGRMLVADGTEFESMALQGDATLDGAGFLSLTADSVDGAEIAANAVGSSEIAAGAVGVSELADINSATATAGRLLLADGTDFESVQLQGDCTINGAGFISCSAGGAVGDLVDLSDVNSATLTAGRLLIADGTDFESMQLQGDATLNGAGFITIGDDAITSDKIATDAVGSDAIAANAVDSSEITANAVGVSELADINSATKTAGRLLIADGTDFESMQLQGDCSINGAGYITCVSDGGATQLDELNDVNSATITAGRLLIADGTEFESMQLQGDATMNGAGFISIADDAIIAAKIATDAVGSDAIAANAVDSSEITANAVGVSELADVNSATKTAGRLLIADGTDFESMQLQGDCSLNGAGYITCVSDGGATQLDELSDINSSTITAGRLLIADGTAFESMQLQGDATMNGAGFITIENDAITAAKIATDAVDSGEIAVNAVGVSELADINSLTVTAGRLLIADGTEFESMQLQGDCSLNGAGYITCVSDGGATQLDELSDVNSATITAGRLLIADGTAFESMALQGHASMNGAGYMTVTGMNVTTGTYVRYNGVNFAAAVTASNNFFTAGAGNLTLTGASNTGAGYQALINTGTGYENSAFGAYALTDNTSGYYNSSLGNFSLGNNLGGSANVAAGYASLWTNTSGNSNTSVGGHSMYSNSSGDFNTAVGGSALYNNTTADENTAVGYVSLYTNATGYSNVAMGRGALYANDDGYQNVSIGTRSLIANTSGFNNVAIGHEALNSNTGGDNNIAIGYFAGENITTGSNNLLIGHDIDAPVATASNQMSIGNLIYGEAVDGSGTTISTGNIGIGISDPASRLHVNGTITATGWSGIDLADLGNVNTETAIAGRLLIADGTDFESMQLQGDCTINGAGFIDCSASAGATQLDALSDVNSATVSAGRLLIADGTEFESMQLQGDATMDGSGFITIADDAITAAKIAADAVGSDAIAANAVGVSELANINSLTVTAGRLLVSDGTDFESMLLQGDCTINGAGFIDCSASAGATQLDALSDVNSATVSAGRLLIADGTEFESMQLQGDATMNGAGFITIADDAVTSAKIATNAVDSAAIAANAVDSSEITANAVGVSELADINSATKTAGRLLIADGTEFESMQLQGDCTINGAGFIDCSASAGATQLDSLSDVNSATVSAGRLLIADGTEFESMQLQGDCTMNGAGFIDCSASAGATQLDALSDVNSSTITAGRLLIADGTEFESMQLQGDATMNGAGFLTLAADSVGSAEIAAGAVDVSELANINSLTVTAGRLLVSDGTDFESMLLQGDCTVNGAGFIDCSASAGATQLDSLSDVNSATITAGRLLIADGTEFESMQLQGDCSLNGAGYITCVSDGGATQLDELSDINSATVSAGRLLIADGTEFESMQLQGDATMNGAGFITLADDVITSAKIATNAVDSAAIAANAVDSSEIVANAVGVSELADINSATKTAGRLLIADGTEFESMQLQGDCSLNGAGFITCVSDGGATQLDELSDINSATITAGRLLIADGTEFESMQLQGDATMDGAGFITIADDAITAAKIAADAVGSDAIAANAVGVSELANINSLTVTAGRLLVSDGTDFESMLLQGDCTINGAGYIDCSASAGATQLDALSDVNSATITAGRLLIADGTEFESMQLQGDATMDGAGFITIADDAITAAKIATDAVGSDAIVANAVGVSELADFNSLTVTAGRLLVTDGTNFESMLLQGDCTINGAGYVDCSASAGATELDALSDVNSATITAGRLLIADGTEFESMQLQGDCTMDGAGFINCSPITYISGDLGIGSTAPLQKLHVEVSNNGLNFPLLVRNADDTQTGGNAVGLAFVNEATGSQIKAAMVHERLAGWGVGSIHFLNASDLNSTSVDLSDARMTIESGGNVGIGTTDPTSALQVVGTITASGWSGIELDDLSDINGTTATAGRLLIADGTEFESMALSGDATLSGTGALSLAANSVDVNELTLINSLTVTAGRLLIADGTEFESMELQGDCSMNGAGYITCSAGGATQLDALGDVNSSTATAGRLLVADGTDFESIGLLYVEPNDVGSVGIGTVSPSAKLHVAGDGYFTEDLTVSSNGSTTGSPRLFGMVDFSAGEAVRWFFGDQANVVQNAHNNAMQIAAYHTIELWGDRNTTSVLSYDNTSDIGVLVSNTIPGSEALVVRGAASQSANLQEWRDSDENVLASITAAGQLSPGLTVLSDVNSSTATGGRLLIADGTDFESMVLSGDATLSGAGALSLATNSVDVNELTLVNSLTVTAGRLLIADGTEFESMTLQGDCSMNGAGYITCSGGGSTQLDELSDVNSATITAGRLLIADGTEFESMQLQGDCSMNGAGFVTCYEALPRLHVGQDAGLYATAADSTLIGYQSGMAASGSLLTGNNNTFIGYQTGLVTTTGGDNTFIGDAAGSKNTTGISNTFVGSGVGVNNVGGDYNTFMGYLAGNLTDEGLQNSFYGHRAGAFNETGNENTFLGGYAGLRNEVGLENTFVGYEAGYNFGRNGTASTGNILLGHAAGYDVASTTNQTGTDNIMIGRAVGTAHTSGNRNILIGPGVEKSGATSSNYLNIGNAFYGSMGTTTSTGTGDASLTIDGSLTISGTVSGVGLDDLSDVNGSTATAGRLLIADGTDFESMALSGDATLSGSGALSLAADSVDVNELTLINSLTVTAGRLLIADGTEFESMELQGDCSMNGAGYITCSGGSGATQLDALSDVNSATVTAGRLLIADGTEFESMALQGDCTMNGAGFVTCYEASSTIHLGQDAGQYSTAVGNTLIGYQAGMAGSGSELTGVGNTFVGYNSGKVNTSGRWNVYIGQSAGLTSTTAEASVVIGMEAGSTQTTGGDNVLIGAFAGANGNGASNVFLGHSAGRDTTTGYDNTIIGSYAGIENEAGYENIFIGSATGDNNTDGARNIIIGKGIDNLTATTDDYINIGNAIYGDGGTTTATGTGDASLTIDGDLTVSGTLFGVDLDDLSDINGTTATAGRLLIADGTDFESMALSGDVSLDGAGAATVTGIQSGTGPTVSVAGDVAIDTTDDQLVFYGGAKRVIAYEETRCAIVESVAAADDDFPMGSFVDAVTVNSVWCTCSGTCSTKATFTLEDGGGNAMTITGTNPTCTDIGTVPTAAAVTAANQLTARESLRFNVTNTPSPETDTYEVCVGYTVDAQ